MEHIEETTQQLQYKIQVLKNQLEEDEKKARKVFPIDAAALLEEWVLFAFGNVSFSIFPTSAAKLGSLAFRNLVFRSWITTASLFSYLCFWGSGSDCFFFVLFFSF